MDDSFKFTRLSHSFGESQKNTMQERKPRNIWVEHFFYFAISQKPLGHWVYFGLQFVILKWIHRFAKFATNSQIELANMADVIEFDEFSIGWLKIGLEMETKRIEMKRNGKRNHHFIRCRFLEFNEPLSWVYLNGQKKIMNSVYYREIESDSFYVTNQNIVSVLYLTSIFLSGHSGKCAFYHGVTRAQCREFQKNALEQYKWDIQLWRVACIGNSTFSMAPVKYNRIIYNYLVIENEMLFGSKLLDDDDVIAFDANSLY